jgi:hypothetical protein
MFLSPASSSLTSLNGKIKTYQIIFRKKEKLGLCRWTQTKRGKVERAVVFRGRDKKATLIHRGRPGTR